MSQFTKVTGKFLSILFLSVSVFVSVASAQKERKISEVQGDKYISPLNGENVKVTGIVTARIRNGFFLQTPDDQTDTNPATSEAIMIFTGSEPDAKATIGNLVTLTGMVMEFVPKQEPASLSVTQVSMKKGVDSIKVVSENNALPKPIILTQADFSPNLIYQLEKYEGMRVTANELTVVAPTDGRIDGKNATSTSDGIFYAVLKGTPRPFREPGYDIYDVFFMKDKEKDEMKKNFPKMPLFDANPETLRIDSDEQLGAQAIEVMSGALVKNLTGVMHYGYQKYTILTDSGAKPEVSNLLKPKAVPPPNDRQFSLVGMNLENFFDDEDDPAIKEDIVTTEAFEKRMKKISLGVREYMNNPDVIGIVEAENLAGLKRLAKRINEDTTATNKPDPKYEAYLIDGNDGRGIDVGFLVKTSRVNVVEVKQFGKDDKFINPEKKSEEILNDRPPLMLRATITDTKTNQPFAFTVVSNHLKSFLGSETLRVRTKRQKQAEFLANFVQERQKTDTNEKIILLGDFNAYQFNDGVVDLIGTIKGTPAPKDQVFLASEDLVNPDMLSLVDMIEKSQRYSYTYDGNAQVLDHFIISESLKKHLVGFGFVRVNADYPESYRGDVSRVEKFSDHDPAIGYFQFDEKQ